MERWVVDETLRRCVNLASGMVLTVSEQCGQWVLMVSKLHEYPIRSVDALAAYPTHGAALRAIGEILHVDLADTDARWINRVWVPKHSVPRLHELLKDG